MFRNIFNIDAYWVPFDLFVFELRVMMSGLIFFFEKTKTHIKYAGIYIMDRMKQNGKILYVVLTWTLVLYISIMLWMMFLSVKKSIYLCMNYLLKQIRKLRVSIRRIVRFKQKLILSICIVSWLKNWRM